MNNPPFLQASGLTKVYNLNRNRIEVLKGITLTIQKGEFISIIGASGVGKSTFLHLLGALDAPTSGELLFEGKNIFSRDEKELALFRNREVGFVFQFHHLLPEFTAQENGAMPALIRGIPRREALEMSRRLLEEVGLGQRLQHKPGELSGGEQQRVAVARALVLGPSLILADEPTGNLDSKTSEEVFVLMRRLNREKKVTLVMVTHNEKLSVQGDRQFEMVDGLIHEIKRG